MNKYVAASCLFLFLLIGADIYSKVNQLNKCKDAGGVYATPSVCINPSAVIEVN